MDTTLTINVQLVLPDTVRTNSSIAGTLEITNRGNKRVELITPDYNAALNLVVFDRLWNNISAKALTKAHVAQRRFELLPGQSESFKLVDLAFTTGTKRMAYHLTPSEYYIVAVYHPGTAKLPEHSDCLIVVTSNVRKLVVE